MNVSNRCGRISVAPILMFLGAMWAMQLPLQAQSESKIDATVEKRNEARKVAFEKSNALFLARDYTSAEAVLFSTNKEKSDTPAWQVESAGKLVQMALNLRSQYDYRAAREVAQRALAYLQQGEKGQGVARGEQKVKRQAYELSGYIYESVLDDLPSAKASYQQALTIDAKSSSAMEALARIAEVEAKRIRIGSKGGIK